jgi:probable HAF family extracellular repeat protein
MMRRGKFGGVVVGCLAATIFMGGIGCGGSGGTSGTITTGVTATSTATTTATTSTSTSTSTTSTGVTGTVASYEATQVAPKIAGAFPTGINDSNEVCGFGGSATKPIAFVWSKAGSTTQLPVPPAITGGAVAMNIDNSGVVVGYGADAANHSRALVWTANVPRDIGDLGGGIALGNGINKYGHVVGYSIDKTGNYQAFVWSGATGMVNLGSALGGPNEACAINDSDVIVGGTGVTGQDGFAYSSTTGFHSLGDFDGGRSTSVGRAINANGEVVGTAQDAAGVNHAFTWTSASGIVRLAEPSGVTASAAYGINSSGLVVGSVVTTAEEACVWSSTGTLRLLTPSTIGLPTGVSLVYAQAINSSGYIVALGSDNNTYFLSPSYGSDRQNRRPPPPR